MLPIAAALAGRTSTAVQISRAVTIGAASIAARPMQAITYRVLAVRRRVSRNNTVAVPAIAAPCQTKCINVQPAVCRYEVIGILQAWYPRPPRGRRPRAAAS